MQHELHIDFDLLQDLVRKGFCDVCMKQSHLLLLDEGNRVLVRDTIHPERGPHIVTEIDTIKTPDEFPDMSDARRAKLKKEEKIFVRLRSLKALQL